MDLTTPINVLMWTIGLVSVGFSLNLFWAIFRRRTSSWGDTQAIDASLKRLEAAFADIDRIEQKLPRDEAVGKVELAVAMAALKRLRKISRVTLAGSEVRVEFDRATTLDLSCMQETLSGLR